jgi:Winged helix DNA-binding domain
MPHSRLQLSRTQVLDFRRRVGSLDKRLPTGAASLVQAAQAGLQDSMPRAALLSLHARVSGVTPADWEHPSLLQLWGPRFHNYVIAAQDLAVFSLGRLPEDVRRRARAYDTAARLEAALDGRQLPFGEAGRLLGVVHNSLRYAAPTGRVLMRWDGARQPLIWTVAAPEVDPREARLALARRYLRGFGPATATAFADWAGITPSEGRAAFAMLDAELMPVHTPIGDAVMLVSDEAILRMRAAQPAPARLLPSGDTYYLLWGLDRELLLPDETQRAALWTSRVWPGALLVNGEIVGIWRRAAAVVDIQAWRRLSAAERQAVEAEAATLPLPDISKAIAVRWN